MIPPAPARLFGTPTGGDRMAVRRSPAVAALVVWCAAAAGQEATPVLPPPSARLAPPGTELPPLLTVPPPPAVPILPPAAACRSCPTDYHPGYTYLPDQDPDWSRGGCDGECRACRTTWVAAEVIFGVAKDLGEVDYRKTLGVWFGGGHWFDDARTAGMDLAVLATSDSAAVASAGPIYREASLTLWTIDANLRAELFEAGQWRFTGLIGYRYLHFREQLVIGSALGVADDEARNEVNAGQIGLCALYRFGPYTCETEAKVAVGRNQRREGVNGFGPSGNDVAVIPEFAARVGYQVGEGKWCTFGYRALYLNNILRPGRGETDFFFHGLTVGFEVRF